jgi:hypothetical protein
VVNVASGPNGTMELAISAIKQRWIWFRNFLTINQARTQIIGSLNLAALLVGHNSWRALLLPKPCT